MHDTDSRVTCSTDTVATDFHVWILAWLVKKDGFL